MICLVYTDFSVCCSGYIRWLIQLPTSTWKQRVSAKILKFGASWDLNIDTLLLIHFPLLIASLQDIYIYFARQDPSSELNIVS